MKTITTAELQQILAAQPSAPLIPTRAPPRLSSPEVHIPQARSIPLDELNPGAIAAPQRPPPVLPRLPHRPPLRRWLRNYFARDGYTQPVVVVGGTLAWFKASTFRSSRG